MPRSGKDDKKKDGSVPDQAPDESPKTSSRPGLPDRDSVLSEKSFTSPKGKRYRILKTDETDAYDEPEPPECEPDR